MLRSMMCSLALCACAAAPAAALGQEAKGDGGPAVIVAHAAPGAAYYEFDAKGGYLGLILAPEGATKKSDGAHVIFVIDGSPASQAGIKQNDVVKAIDGKQVKSHAELVAALAAAKPGQRVTLEVERDGRRETLTATLGAQPSAQAFFGQGAWGKGGQDRTWLQTAPNGDGNLMFVAARPRLGVSTIELTDQLREFFGVEQDKGVLVSEVIPNSPAAKAGIKAGDVIVSIEGSDVAGRGSLVSELAKAGDDAKTLSVGVVRDRARQSLSVTVDASDTSWQPRVEWKTFPSTAPGFVFPSKPMELMPTRVFTAPSVSV